MSLNHLNKQFEDLKIKPPTDNEKIHASEILKNFSYMSKRGDFNELKNYLTKIRNELRKHDK